MRLQRPKGTQDVLPGQSEKWQYLENLAHQIFKKYNYSEIRTPIFEHYGVVSRSVGSTTDIVTKEMYDFYDKGGRRVTLRPEGTAPVVRAYVENRLYAPEIQQPVKCYYIGPMFRYERPQTGRLRQFHQIGAECLGSTNPAVDVEAIALSYQYFKEIGLKNVMLHLNSLGNSRSRLLYRKALVNYLAPLEGSLSEASRRRFEENPFRVLDSKEVEDELVVENAPSILDYLDDDSHAYFRSVQGMLTSLSIPYVINTKMVRGLDYYDETVFEFTMKEVLGRELTICAGGRYNDLVTYFDGPKTSAFGFGMGIERLLVAVEKQGLDLSIDNSLDVYIVVLGDSVNTEALKLVQSLREQGFSADRDYSGRKLKSQFKSSDSFKSKVILTLGKSEVEDNQVTVKNNKTRGSVTVSFNVIKTNFRPVFEEVLEK